MSETQAAMGAIARGQRFLDAVGSDDPDHILTWGEARDTIAQLIGDLHHEKRVHEQTLTLLGKVERSAEDFEWRLHQVRPVLTEVEAFLRPCAEDGDRGCERELLANVRAALLKASPPTNGTPQARAEDSHAGES